ncbi:MAG TPA: hypothetical protein VK861_05185, partial [Bacteroidales bacterium]|nr:hypothetical protein [Bacteroidales bacterium]
MKEVHKNRLNLSSVKAALKTIHELRKEYIQVLFINAILQAVRPFVPIVFSAMILDELLGNRDMSTLLRLAGLLVGLMLLSHILSG